MLVMRFSGVQWPAPLSLHSMFKAQYQCQVIIIKYFYIKQTNYYLESDDCYRFMSMNRNILNLNISTRWPTMSHVIRLRHGYMRAGLAGGRPNIARHPYDMRFYFIYSSRRSFLTNSVTLTNYRIVFKTTPHCIHMLLIYILLFISSSLMRVKCSS